MFRSAARSPAAASFEYRTKDHEVGALHFRAPSRLHAMHGRAQQPHMWPNAAHGQTIFRQVHAVDSGRKRDIEPVIDKYFGGASGSQVFDAADKVEKLGRGEIFFAHLNHVHALPYGARRVCEEIAAAAISDVATEHHLSGHIKQPAWAP